MKKLNFGGFCLILFLFCGSILFGQNSNSLDSNNKPKFYADKRISTELFFHFPYYFLHSPDWQRSENINYSNYFNYGGGILIYKYFNKIKLGTGIYFSTKNYHRGNNSQIIDKVNYINIIPISFYYTAAKFNPFFELVINKPYYYNNVNNKTILNEINEFASPPNHFGTAPPKVYNIYYSNNKSFRFGIDYKNDKIGKLLNIHIKLFFDYRFYDDTFFCREILKPDYSTTAGHMLIGINFGLEILTARNFNNKK